MIKRLIQSFIKARGYCLLPLDKYQSVLKFMKEDQRRKNLFNYLAFDLVLDVGAHKGGFCDKLFHFGYKGDVISFEPVKENFEILKTRKYPFNSWEVYCFGLGSVSGKVDINLSANTHSSSILDMLDTHQLSAPDSLYIGSELIQLRTIDELFPENYFKDKKTLIKIDTQGFEKSVLSGASKSILDVAAVQLEVSLVPLYLGSWSFQEVLDYFQNLGFELWSIENGFFDKITGRLLQVDAVFSRK